MLSRFTCLILIVFICSPLLGAEKIVLQLKWEHEFQFAGYYAAKWQGFYEQQGLDVEIRSAIRQNKSIIDPNAELRNGNAQFAIGASGLILNKDSNNDPVLLASIFQRSPIAIFSLQNTDISTLEKLSKLRIASVDSSFSQLQVAALFAAENYDPANINFVEQPITIETLLNGKADAIITYDISAQFSAKENNIKLNKLSLDDLGFEFYGDSLYTSFTYAQTHPDIVEKFTEASKKGWLYALQHKQEIAARIAHQLPRYLVKYNNFYQYNLAFADAIDGLIQYPEKPLGFVNEARWLKINEEMRALGLVQSHLNERLFQFTAENSSAPPREHFYYLIILAFFLPVIVFFWYRQYKILTIFAVLGALTVFAQQVEDVVSNEENIVRRGNHTQQLNSISAKLQGQLQNSLSLLAGFAAYISVTPDLSYDDYNRYAKSLFEKDPLIINFAAAKDLVVNYVYPLAGNEQVVGLDYRQTPNQLITVKQIIKNKQVVISDPVTFIQGGTGVIARAPIFLEDGTLWGIISAPLNTQLLYKHSGINSTLDEFEIAIRSIDEQGRNGATFLGDPATFDAAHKLQSFIPVGSNTWQIAITPTSSIQSLSSNIYLLRAYFIISALLISLFIWFKFTQTSEKQKLESKLRDDKRLLDSVGQVAKIGGWKIDKQLNFLEWSEQASLVIDKPKNFYPETLMDLKNYFSEKDYRLWQQKIETALQQSTGFNISLQFTTENKTPLWLGLISDGRSADDNQFIIGTIQDISEKISNAQLIEYQASYDSLTDLPNRRTYQDRLKQAIKNAQRNNQQLAVLFVDLDRFKPINDNHGHQAGDQVLIEAAKRLEQMLRKSDTVSRLSGDEFALILNDIKHHTHALTIAEKISETMQTPYQINHISVHLSVSIGIALYPEDAQKADSLLKKADQAMYEVKNNGRNGYQFYTREMQLKSERRHDLLNRLIEALNNKVLQPYFQPIVELHTQQIKKCETLARWQQEDGSFVSPGEFINLAEESGLINKIDLFMLEESTRILCEMTPEIDLSINVSPRLFHTKDNALQDWVSVLKKVSKSINITVEITERLLTDDSEKALLILNQLRQLGIKIAIDDFGTGYSSLNYLLKFPVDIIKIDRSFIKNIGLDKSCEALIETILGMARRLAIEVVAEGIETQEQLTYLQKNNCDYGQGYFLGKPVSKEDFHALVSR